VGEREQHIVGRIGGWASLEITVPVKLEAKGVGFLGERFAREKRKDNLGEGEREEAVNHDCWEKE
jgi:hypothetical protein